MSNMVVNTNVLALNSHRALKGVGAQQAKASQKLSSGLRINKAADDAAGLAISEKMRSQIKGLNQASRNSQDGQSMIQVAEGALNEVSNMVQRTQELTTQAANDTNTQEDRYKLTAEMVQLAEEIAQTGQRVEFNGKKVLQTVDATGAPAATGTIALNGQSFQVGANSSELLTIGNVKLDLNKVATTIITAVDDINDTGNSNQSAATTLDGLTGKVTYDAPVYDSTKPLPTTHTADISTQIDLIKAEVTSVTDARAAMGAYDNRLDYTVKSLDLMSENLATAESRIRDTDMAKEMMNLQKANVLQQAATSMLAQANQGPQNILQLLR